MTRRSTALILTLVLGLAGASCSGPATGNATAAGAGTAAVAPRANASGSGGGDDVVVNVVLRPVRGGGQEVAAIESRVEVVGTPPPQEKPFTVQAPITYAGVTGIADRIEAVEARDQSGVVALSVEDEPADPGGFPYYRLWRAGRDVVYPVVVTYRSRPQPEAVRGPQFSFRAHAGGVSTAGSGLLALPVVPGEVTTRVRWDLSDLAPGSIAGSTFGEGDLELRGPLHQLTQGFYMAGPLGRYAPEEAGGKFIAYWLGQPPFDPLEEMSWAWQSYRFQEEFFNDASAPAYRIFVRALPEATRVLGGTALQNSFLLAVPVGSADKSVKSPRETIAHEIGHMFVGGISGKGPTTWFGEGLNVHYTRLLLLRSGLEPVDAYLESVNKTAQGYYSNPYRNESADALQRLGFSAGVGEGSAQNVPYTRGSLYFAAVDWKIRDASGGKRTLDDVMLPLFERRRNGQPFDTEELLAAFEKEYGPGARADFESVIVRGETIEPPSGAFGPCLERRPKKYSFQGKEYDGYEWVRVPPVADERCRAW